MSVGSGCGGHWVGTHPACVERRLRGGKSLVACAPQAFADPFAYTLRSIEPVIASAAGSERLVDSGQQLADRFQGQADDV